MTKTLTRTLHFLFVFGIVLSLIVNGTLMAAAQTEQIASPTVYIPGCMVTDSYDSAVPQAWYALIFRLVQTTPGYSPPVTARTLGYTGVTLYEAVVPGMPGYQSLAGKLNGLEASAPMPPFMLRHWPTVANAALATITRKFFTTTSSENLAAIEALEEQFHQEFATSIRPDVIATSIAQGQATAERIFAWAQSDGGHEGYLRNQPEDYVPLVGNGLWIPTPPAFGRALQPTWGDNRTMLLTSAAQCLPPEPPPFSTAPDSAMYQEGLEVYNTVKNLTPYQLETARYWADNPGASATPPGHMLSITTQILAQEHSSLARAALVYAKVGITVNDAFISAWHAKYQYNRIRPISYIQQVIDPAWNNPEITDPVITPPFPSYPSGHSVASGSTMTVLTDLFGEAYKFTDLSQVSQGFVPRTFTSFVEAGQEAALSRLLGGIHFRSDNEGGFDHGICIGNVVNGLRFEK